MPLQISHTFAKNAVMDGIDPLDHSGVIEWCQNNITGFVLLKRNEKHALASHVQVKAAVIKIEGPKSDEDEDEDWEGGVSLVEVTGCGIMEMDCLKKAERDPASHKGKKKKTRLPVVNHVTESVTGIASRVMQTDLDFRHPQSTLLLWAWCVLNVAGFVESHPQFRKGISEGVTRLLVSGDGTSESTADDTSGPRLQHEGIESAEARKRRKRKEKWYNQVRESTDEIANRFPYQQLDYSIIHNVTAWCILNIDGFAESGMIPRHQIPSKIQEVLEEIHGPYEDDAQI